MIIPIFLRVRFIPSRGMPVVEFGSVDSALLKEFDIKQAVFAAEFNWDNVLKILADHRILFKSLPRFQVVTRDFSLMLDRKVTFESLRTLAFKTEKKLLKRSPSLMYMKVIR